MSVHKKLRVHKRYQRSYPRLSSICMLPYSFILTKSSGDSLSGSSYTSSSTTFFFRRGSS